jgi:putative peptidoglycan lipid II flippase
VNTHTSTDNAKLKKALTIATVIMMGSVLLSRVIGLVREQVIATLCGTSTEIDAYVTAFFIPELLNHFLASGFLSITFIPIFQRYLHANDRVGAWRSFSNLMSLGTVAFAVVIPLSIVFTPAILHLLGPNITNAQTLPLTVKMTRIILPAQLFMYWGAFFSAVQMAQHRFTLPALAPLLYNIGIILGGFLLKPLIGVEGFAWGVLFGAFAGNVVLQQIGARRIGMRFTFRLDWTHHDVKEFIILTLPLVVGVGMTFSNEIFFRFFSSFLGEGDTASINYALRTMGAVVAVFGQASGVAFFPFLSRLAIEKKYLDISVLLNKAITKIAAYCIPLSALFFIIAPQIIAVLYEHGRFTAASTARTAPIFAMYMIGAFAFSVAVFVVRPFFAIQKMYLPMVVSSIIALLSLPLYYFASKWWGTKGIALSAIAGMSAQFIVLYVLWVKRYGERVSTIALLKTGTKILVIAAAASIGGGIVRQEALTLQLGWGKTVDAFTIGAITALPFTAIVIILYHLTGVQNARELLSIFNKKR